MAEARGNGGRARAAALSAQERRDIASAAARARWSQNGSERVEGPVPVLPTHQPAAAQKRLDKAVKRTRAVIVDFRRIANDAGAAADALTQALVMMEKSDG